MGGTASVIAAPIRASAKVISKKFAPKSLENDSKSALKYKDDDEDSIDREIQQRIDEEIKAKMMNSSNEVKEARKQDIVNLKGGSTKKKDNSTSIPKDGNSISRLALGHLKTNLTNTKRDPNSSTTVRDISFDMFDDLTPAEVQAQQIQKQAMAVHALSRGNSTKQLNIDTNQPMRILGPIIENDLQTPTSPSGSGFRGSEIDQKARIAADLLLPVAEGDEGSYPDAQKHKLALYSPPGGASTATSTATASSQAIRAANNSSSIANTNANTVAKKTIARKKPGLSIAVNSEKDYSNIPSDMRLFMASQSNVIYNSERSTSIKRINTGGSKRKALNTNNNDRENSASSTTIAGHRGLAVDLDPSSRRVGGDNDSSHRQVNTRGDTAGQSETTVRVGDFKIRSSGISLADENSRRIARTTRSDAATGAMLVALGGSFNFVEIASLGAGASGTVVEALHIPTLTIVALKMLPCYNQAKRASIESELAVLCKL